MRRKNRKLRRVRELYPDIRIKLFYGKDFKALLLKYGRFDLAASLSGLEGQAAASPPVEDAPVAPAPIMARRLRPPRRSRLRRLLPTVRRKSKCGDAFPGVHVAGGRVGPGLLHGVT